MAEGKQLQNRWNYDFLGKRHAAFLLSALLIVASVYIWIARGSGRYGIDFRGGHEFVVKIEGQSSVENVRQALEKGALPEARVQSFEIELVNSPSREYLVQLGLAQESESATGATALRQKVTQALQGEFPNRIEIVRSDFVGPTIGEELKERALIALALGLVGIMIYVTWRFEFAFALGAVVALFHDVIVALGVYLWVGHDINMSTLAAALTIIGYSVNDTIVIFDRVREEIFKRKEFDLAQLMNDSMNAMLSRTIITSLLTLFAVVALLVLGGGSIADLSLFLFAGMISGIYSTVFIAAPVVLYWQGMRDRRVAAESQRAA